MALHKKLTPATITFKGAKYELVSGERLEIPAPAEDYKPLPQEETIYVRMSMDDFQLLASLPEATYGPVRKLLQRANQKKLEGGRAEVTATETEVADVIAALEDFIDEEEGAPASIAHAQDMLSSWKRNYLLPDKPLSKPMPSYKSELPRSTNIRMFHYKGAKYVLVRAADDPDYLGKRESPTMEDVVDIDAEVFSNLFINDIQQAIKENVPIAQIKDSVDKIQNARQSLDNASMALNNDRAPGARWLTDSFFSGKYHSDRLVELMQNPDLVRESINKFIHDVQKAHKATQTAMKVIEDINTMIVDRGWASKWALKKGRSQLTKDILREFYNLNDTEIEAFMKNAYNIIGQRKSKRSKEEPLRASAATVKTIRYAGHNYTLCE